jgi:hypothetical protein
MRQKLSCGSLSPLFLLLFLLAVLPAAALSRVSFMRFESLLNSGDHEGAHHAAEELTVLKPHDGYSWYFCANRPF